MPYLVIYDSARDTSKLTALTALFKYPTATVKDFKALSASTINTYIGNLTAGYYDKIIMCVNNTRVEEVVSTATVTVTEGTANEVGFLTVDNQVDDPFPIGVVTADGSGSYHDAIALTASINAGTADHGYSAARTNAVITISAPTGSGATGDTHVLAQDVTNGGTITLALTANFSGAVAGVTAVGVSGDITQEDFIDAEAAMLNEAVTGTATAGGNQTVTLAVGSSAVNDYYNGMQIMILTNAGSNQVRVITDYVGSTRVATVDYVWGTNPGNTSTYAISEDLLEFGRTVSSILPARRVWETLTATAQPYELPTLLNILGGATETYWCAKNDKTSTAMAAGTLTDSGEFVANAYNSATHSPAFYVGIKTSADGGVGEIIKITSNTTGVLTLAHNWKDTPAAASVYQIGHKSQMLWDEYLPLAIETYANFSGNTYPSAAVATFQKMIDKYKGVAAGKRTIFDGVDELEEMAELGKTIFAAKAEEVVS